MAAEMCTASNRGAPSGPVSAAAAATTWRHSTAFGASTSARSDHLCCNGKVLYVAECSELTGAKKGVLSILHAAAAARRHSATLDAGITARMDPFEVGKDPGSGPRRWTLQSGEVGNLADCRCTGARVVRSCAVCGPIL